MKPYKHTPKQEYALIDNLNNYFDIKCYLYQDFYTTWDELDEAIKENDTEWIEKHTKEMELINKKIKAIYKASEILSEAFQKVN
jgi:endonuclease III